MFSVDVGKFKVDKVGFDFVFNEPAGAPVGRWMRAHGRAATREAKLKVGVRTGNLRRAIAMEQDRKGPGRQQRVRIGVLKGGRRGYALYHHEGTKPHTIRGKRGGMMTFTSGGRVIRARTVQHPGTRPNRYLTNAMRSFMR